MESSVDSIGTCSLDVDASAAQLGAPDSSAEATSTDTLRSASIITTPDHHHQQQHQHLPSYLSLACTVNGYSTITNYDPVRLAKSRDASPHRLDSDLTPRPSFSVQGNLLSPPNLIVPLPRQRMEDVTQYYGGMKTTASFKETRYSQFLAKDSVDGCVENGHVRVQTKCSSFESKTSYKYTSDMAETKSFIQQSVERLYGPGALAQGFFISKRQKNNRRLSESEEKLRAPDGDDAHSRSMTDHLLLEDELGQLSMRQSASTPTLPVLRHLRPEFRAQLPIHSPRRGLVEEAAQKVATASKLKLDEEEEDEQEVVVKLNGHDEGTRESDGHVKISNGHASEKSNGYLKGTSNGDLQIAEDDKEELETKDGHYFLKILETQTKRLLALADRVEEDLTSPGLSEEVIGKLRSASGKARLLASQKMQQFRGLCTNNINRSLDEAFPTTNEDLQGFWDMVMLQVNQVYAIFDEIDELRRNDWREETGAAGASPATNGTAPKAKRGSGGRPRTSPTAPQNEEARKQRERDRKRMIEERRKAMRAQQRGKGAEGVEFFVTESS